MAVSVPGGPFSQVNSERPGVNANYGLGNVNQVNEGDMLQHVVQSESDQTLPLSGPRLQAPNNIRNSFMPANYTAPYYNAAAVAGNVGTMLGQAAPGAAGFLNQLFNPELNNFEQMYLAAGLGNATVAQEQAMGRQEAQFEGTPFHSGMLAAQGDVMNQTARDALSTAGQMGMQRQQLAASQVQYPFQGAMEASQVPVQMAEKMYNLGNNAYGQYNQLGMQTWSGIPVPSTVVQPGGGGNNKSII